jgi:hypothetical protein
MKQPITLQKGQPSTSTIHLITQTYHLLSPPSTSSPQNPSTLPRGLPSPIQQKNQRRSTRTPQVWIRIHIPQAMEESQYNMGSHPLQWFHAPPQHSYTCYTQNPNNQAQDRHHPQPENVPKDTDTTAQTHAPSATYQTRALTSLETAPTSLHYRHKAAGRVILKALATHNGPPLLSKLYPGAGHGASQKSPNLPPRHHSPDPLPRESVETSILRVQSSCSPPPT